MAETWNKREREKKKQQQKKEKAEKKQERKDQNKSGKSFDDMISYVDENGNFSSTPPDPKKRVEIALEDIPLGVPKYDEADEAASRRNGVVSYFNHGKGFGFITDKQTGERLFIHVKSLSIPIEEGMKVTFEAERGPKGMNAVNVELVK